MDSVLPKLGPGFKGFCAESDLAVSTHQYKQNPIAIVAHFFRIHYPHSHMKRAYIDILHRPPKPIFCITAFGLSQQPEYVYKHAVLSL